MSVKAHGAAGEPIPIGNEAEAAQTSNTQGLPPSSTEGMHKEPEEWWTRMIEKLERFVEAEPEGPRRENIVACLHFAREHGYPEDPYCLWAIDGVARCTDKFEFVRISSGDDRENSARHAFGTLGGRTNMVYQVSSITCPPY